jgi:hypothetical protein
LAEFFLVLVVVLAELLRKQEKLEILRMSLVIESAGFRQINKQKAKDTCRRRGQRLLLRLRLRRRGDVFFGYVVVGPWAAQVEKLDFEKPDHLHFRRETASLKHPVMAVIVLPVFIVVAAVGIQFSVVGVGRTRNR